MSVDPRIGTVLAGYRVEALIGRGATGAVYVAEQLRLGRKVALKILSSELAADGVFRRRFVRESHLAAGIEHPGIVPIYDAGDEDGTLYMSMRLVEGSDLATELARGRLDPDRSIRLVAQVADALDTAHGHGLVHRDVKPANILLATGPGAGERAYLSDFGIAKRSGSLSGLTQTGHFVGTVDYVSPEQIRDADIDGRADQYSLACVLYHCLTGEPPFPRATAVAVIYAHLNDEAPRPSAFDDGVSPSFDPIVARGLAKSPDERFASCTALVVAAAEALRGGATASVPVSPRTAASGDRSRAKRVRRLTIVAVAAALAAALIASIITLVPGLTDGAGRQASPTSSPVVTSVSEFTWTEVDRAAGVAGRGNQSILRAVEITTGIVAVGYRDSPEGDKDAAVWISDEGSEWNPRLSQSLGGPGDQEATGIVRLGASLFVVGWDNAGGDDDPAVWTSNDNALSWDRVALGTEITGAGDQQMRRVVRLGSGLVAVGYERNPSGRDQDVAVWRSRRGTSWVRADTLTFTGSDEEEARSVAVIGGQPVAVGSVTSAPGTSREDQDAAVWRLNADSNTWIQVGGAEALGGRGDQQINDVVAGGPGLVAVGVEDKHRSGEAAVWTSTNGEEWSRVPAGQASLGGEGRQQMQGVAVVRSELIAVGTEHLRGQLNGALWTSEDGIDWTRTSPTDVDVTALSGRGQQYVIEVITFRDGVIAFGRIGTSAHSDAGVWLALPRNSA